MKIICTLPNASDLINGVKFAPHEDGTVISEDVSSEVAANFLEIPGYTAHDPAEAARLAMEAADRAVEAARAVADAAMAAALEAEKKALALSGSVATAEKPAPKAAAAKPAANKAKDKLEAAAPAADAAPVAPATGTPGEGEKKEATEGGEAF